MRPNHGWFRSGRKYWKWSESGVRDNFFELGGHSLLAVRLFTRIQEEFNQSLPLMLLFQEGTVEGDWPRHSLMMPEFNSPPGNYTHSTERVRSSHIYHISRFIHAHSGDSLGLFTPCVRPADSTQNGKVAYRKSVQETAAVSIMITWSIFYPQGPYILLGHSAHGYFTLELARLLIKTGQDVAFLGLLDTYPPEMGRQTDPVEIGKRYANNF